MSEQSEWENCLSERLSRAGVVEYARALHNDEQGISRLCRILLTTGDTRRAGNAAWILSHLSGEDKRIYLLPFYDELVDMAMRPDLKIRRALLLSLLADLPVTEDFRADLLDYCLCGCFPRTAVGRNETEHCGGLPSGMEVHRTETVMLAGKKEGCVQLSKEACMEQNDR